MGDDEKEKVEGGEATPSDQPAPSSDQPAA